MSWGSSPPNPVIGLYAAVELLPILVSTIFWRLAPAGVPPPVLPFVEHHKPHDIINTLFSPRLFAFVVPTFTSLMDSPRLFAFADPTFTSLMEHIRQFIVRYGLAAFFFQQVLGINPAVTNELTLDSPQVLEAKQQTAGEIWELVFAANG